MFFEDGGISYFRGMCILIEENCVFVWEEGEVVKLCEYFIVGLVNGGDNSVIVFG